MTGSLISDIGIAAGALISVIMLIGLITRWKLTRWVWLRLVTEPGDARFARRASLAVGPLIDGVRQAGKAQHDEQNTAIANGFKSVNERLDRGSERMDEQLSRIENLETRDEANSRTLGIVDAVHDSGNGLTMQAVSSRNWVAADGRSGTTHLVWCPTCDRAHGPTDAWQYDGNAESPTFSPSILVTGGPVPGLVCHSFLRAGVWEFLSDCTHAMAGQSVPVVPVPDWLIKEETSE